MTDPEMNAPTLKKMIRPIFVAMLVVVPGLSGCIGAFDPQVDTASPVAPRVAALVEANRTFPRWEDFPKTEAAPQPAQLATRVNTLRATGGALAGEVERLEWTLADPETFQRDVAARIDAVQASPASIETLADIEARAAALRARATPPPPIDRRN